jgi:hypothetical protein
MIIFIAPRIIDRDNNLVTTPRLTVGQLLSFLGGARYLNINTSSISRIKQNIG